MNDVGFSGTSNLFANRFKAGEPISAGQLNDIISGVSTALPLPYIGEGPVVSYTPGGANILSADNSITRSIIQQFQIRVNKSGSGFQLRVAQGRVLFKDCATATDPSTDSVLECWVVGWFGYPTGALHPGTIPSATWVNGADAYLTISPGP